LPGAANLEYQDAPIALPQGDASMASHDELLQERRQTWHAVTKVSTAFVVTIAVILLLMLLFLV
jgi:hypothetical protein